MAFRQMLWSVTIFRRNQSLYVKVADDSSAAAECPLVAVMAGRPGPPVGVEAVTWMTRTGPCDLELL